MKDLSSIVPYPIALLIDEIAGCETPKQMRKTLRGMLRDLRDQSEAYINSGNLRNHHHATPGEFTIHLHGALDLLSGYGCRTLPCRMAAADRVARSVGLIADRVWITDTLSDRFVDFGRATNEKIDQTLSDLMVVARIFPLIEAGVVSLRAPTISTCLDCTRKFDTAFESLSREVLEVFRREFKIKGQTDESITFDTGNCFDPPMLMFVPKKHGGVDPSLRDFSEYYVSDQIRSALWIAREAAMTGGSLFSNSRVGLAGLLRREGRLENSQSLTILDREREFALPWVSNLSPSQIVDLRTEAASALPVFRERMARAMSAADPLTPSSHLPAAVISDLREQAAEVRAELESKQKHAARFWKATYGILGLGLSAYGVASDQVTPGVGGLLPVLQLLINHISGHESEAAKVTTKPGYVLVKAQDILAHEH